MVLAIPIVLLQKKLRVLRGFLMKLTPLVFYGMHLRALQMDFDLVWERRLALAPIKLMLEDRLVWTDWLSINIS